MFFCILPSNVHESLQTDNKNISPFLNYEMGIIFEYQTMGQNSDFPL